MGPAAAATGAAVTPGAAAGRDESVAGREALGDCARDLDMGAA